MIEMAKFDGQLGSRMGLHAYYRCLCWEMGWDFEYPPRGMEMLEKYQDRIRKLYGTGILPTLDRVSLHIRRTDYLRPEDPHPNLWEQGYYQKALARFPDAIPITVFSDDIDWCKKQALLDTERFEFSEGRTAVQDMNLMASCRHHIIANSCFSWWAAWLGQWPGTVTVAPKYWDKSGEHLTPMWKGWVAI